MGFVSRVVPGGLKGVEDEAIRMGKLIASKSPIAVLGTKNILNCESRDGHSPSMLAPADDQDNELDSRDHS